MNIHDVAELSVYFTVIVSGLATFNICAYLIILTFCYCFNLTLNKITDIVKKKIL